MGRDSGPETVKARVYALGCRTNQYDAEAMLTSLLEAGYEPAAPGEPADVCIVATCAVTAQSERKSRQMIRRAAADNPGAVVAATGCLSQRSPRDVAAMEGVSLVIGNSGRRRIAELADAARRGKIVAVSPLAGERFEEMAVRYDVRHVRANVKIQEGCAGRCAYCAIAEARGPARSRPIENIAEECRRLSQAGCREIVLTGINLSAYGTGLPGNLRLADAAEAAAGAMAEGRVRLGSLEPDAVTGDFAARMALLGERICPHFHVPLQSGCDRTLARMGRGYTAGEYRDRIAVLRSAIPGAAISTDVMAGFPGETGRDYEASEAFVRGMGFSRVHVFPYSPRPGTPAARMPGRIDAGTLLGRAARMGRAATELEAAFAASLAGRTLRVLFEETAGNGLLAGTSGEFAKVRAPGPPGLIGTIADVCVEKIDDTGVRGRVVANNGRACYNQNRGERS